MIAELWGVLLPEPESIGGSCTVYRVSWYLASLLAIRQNRLRWI